jgi:hypothetical protein
MWVIFENPEVKNTIYPLAQQPEPIRVETIVAIVEDLDSWLQTKKTVLQLTNPTVTFKQMEITEETKRKPQNDLLWTNFFPNHVGPKVFYFAKWIPKQGP